MAVKEPKRQPKPKRVSQPKPTRVTKKSDEASAKSSKATIARSAGGPALHEAILVHAEALNRLAAAIENHSLALRPSPMSQAQKIGELKKLFGIHAALSAKSKLTDFIEGGPGAIAAFYPKIDQWPPFVQRGLHLYIPMAQAATTFGELADAIH